MGERAGAATQRFRRVGGASGGTAHVLRRAAGAAIALALLGLLGADAPVRAQDQHRVLLPAVWETLPRVRWTGTTNTGLPVAFDVADTQVTHVSLTVYLQSGAPTCSATVPFQIDGPIPITAGRFHSEGYGTGPPTIDGVFTSASAASGTYAVEAYPLFCYVAISTYAFASGTWTAHAP